MLKLSAVIFDMDGLMVDSEPLAQAGWRLALAEYGYTLSDDLYMQVLGRSTEGTQAILRQALGDQAPLESMFARKRQYVQDEVTQHGVPVKPGLVELLDWLDGRRIAKAVASSARREDVEHKLGHTHLLARFETIVTGDQVPRGKPAPDIFLAAAERLGVPAEACAVLEDSDAGIQAAYAAGMLPLMVPDIKPPSPETAALAYRIFPSLHEVRAFLEAEYDHRRHF